jgi:hypothetical protein
MISAKLLKGRFLRKKLEFIGKNKEKPGKKKQFSGKKLRKSKIFW